MPKQSLRLLKKLLQGLVLPPAAMPVAARSDAMLESPEKEPGRNRTVMPIVVRHAAMRDPSACV
tara:strand:+ start:176 stop:367 length:192 start_codon:yes stop_codon:yes gene_type:complete